MILYLSSRTTETEILSLADKVKKMLKCARKKSIEKKERDSLSFLSKLSTETLKRIAFGNMTKEELEEVIENVNSVENENHDRDQ